MIYDNITSKDDFKLLFGLDLDIELGTMPNDTGDKPAARFINMIEDYVKTCYEEPNYRWDGNVKDGNQKNCFIKAICYQIDYVLESDTLNFSGFQSDKGVMITRKELEALGISTYCDKFMRKGGMANLTGSGSASSLEGVVVNQ